MANETTTNETTTNETTTNETTTNETTTATRYNGNPALIAELIRTQKTGYYHVGFVGEGKAKMQYGAKVSLANKGKALDAVATFATFETSENGGLELKWLHTQPGNAPSDLFIAHKLQIVSCGYASFESGIIKLKEQLVKASETYTVLQNGNGEFVIGKFVTRKGEENFDVYHNVMTGEVDNQKAIAKVLAYAKSVNAGNEPQTAQKAVRNGQPISNWLQLNKKTSW